MGLARVDWQGVLPWGLGQELRKQEAAEPGLADETLLLSTAVLWCLASMSTTPQIPRPLFQSVSKEFRKQLNLLKPVLQEPQGKKFFDK